MAERTTKFKVGDILKPTIDDTGLIKLHVNEVHIQLCYSGIEQVHYLCRVWVKAFKSSVPQTISRLIEFSEIEVETWLPPTKTVS